MSKPEKMALVCDKIVAALQDAGLHAQRAPGSSDEPAVHVDGIVLTVRPTSSARAGTYTIYARVTEPGGTRYVEYRPTIYAPGTRAIEGAQELAKTVHELIAVRDMFAGESRVIAAFEEARARSNTRGIRIEPATRRCNDRALRLEHVYTGEFRATLCVQCSADKLDRIVEEMASLAERWRA